MARPRVHLFIDKRKWQSAESIAAATRERTKKPCADRTAADKLAALYLDGKLARRGEVGSYEYRGQS